MTLVRQNTTRNEYFRMDEPRTQAAQSRDSIYAEPGKVTHLTSNYLSGLRRDSGKRWWRWSTEGATVLFLTKDGHVAGRKKMGRRWVSLIDFGFANVVDNRPIVAESLGKPVEFNSVFPLAQHWGIRTQETIPRGLVKGMRQENLPDAVRVLYGKTRYRRDLVKAAGRAEANAVGFSRDFLGLVPIDWIINFLRINEGVDNYGRYDRLPHVRKYLFTMDPRSYRDLLNVHLDARLRRTIEDTARMQNMLAGYGREPIALNGRYRNWSEVHDAIQEEYHGERLAVMVNNGRGYGKNVRKDIPVTGLGKKLDGLTFGNRKIVVPKTRDELISWGGYMRNCIGSYAGIVARDDAQTVLGAVYEGDIMIANLEIDRGEIKQLLGRFNRNLGADTRKEIENALVAQGVTMGRNGYWGQVDDRDYGW